MALCTLQSPDRIPVLLPTALFFLYCSVDKLPDFSRCSLSKFRDYFNTCHPNMSFSFEQEKNGKLSFLDVEVSWVKGKLVTNVYRKPAFSGVYTRFKSFLL